MKIILDSVSKSYIENKIVHDLNCEIHSGGSYAILGPNGSGKSTLLGMIAGLIRPNSGTIKFYIEDKEIPTDNLYPYVSLTGPYIELIEDFTLLELIEVQLKLKETYTSYSTVEFALKCLFKERDFQTLYKNFSSGMKQRLKLGFAILSKSNILLLDEPFSNLDQEAKSWYENLLVNNRRNRTLIIASNEPLEYAQCENRIHLGQAING